MCIKQGRFHAPAYCYQSIHLSGLSLFLFRFGLCCSFLWSTIAWLSLSFCKMLVLAFSAISGFLVLSHHSLNVLKAFGTQKRPGTFVPSLLKSAIADDYLFENDLRCWSAIFKAFLHLVAVYLLRTVESSGLLYAAGGNFNNCDQNNTLILLSAH